MKLFQLIMLECILEYSILIIRRSINENFGAEAVSIHNVLSKKYYFCEIKVNISNVWYSDMKLPFFIFYTESIHFNAVWLTTRLQQNYTYAQTYAVALNSIRRVIRSSEQFSPLIISEMPLIRSSPPEILSR